MPPFVARFQSTMFSRLLVGQEWKEGDEEDDEWFEDTHENLEKMRGKRAKAFDPNDPNALLQNALKSEGQQMLFITMRESFRATKQMEELGLRYQGAASCPV